MSWRVDEAEMRAWLKAGHAPMNRESLIDMAVREAIEEHSRDRREDFGSGGHCYEPSEHIPGFCKNCETLIAWNVQYVTWPRLLASHPIDTQRAPTAGGPHERN
jgi:hypothetical protein